MPLAEGEEQATVAMPSPSAKEKTDAPDRLSRLFRCEFPRSDSSNTSLTGHSPGTHLQPDRGRSSSDSPGHSRSITHHAKGDPYTPSAQDQSHV